jgi:kynurenine 3-monooxygenase
MEPFLGQGANAALEDCVVLMACVEDAGGDFREAFASFFERRKPDADAIGLLSTVNYHEMGTSVTTARFQSARRLEQQLQQRHPERFVPQYALIAFHRIPYAQARARGELQARLIGEIVARQERGERLEMAALDAYVCDHLAPLAGPASPIQQPSLAARPPGPRATELKAPAVELEEH